MPFIILPVDMNLLKSDISTIIANGLLAVCLAFFSCLSAADSTTFGKHTVHYIAVNSTFISPEIAQQYGITRGDRRAFLNISVLENSPDENGKPVTANVSALKKNLIGQAEEISFKEVREGKAVYYIGQFTFSNAENLNFEINITPEGETQAETFSYKTRMYNN